MLRRLFCTLGPLYPSFLVEEQHERHGSRFIGPTTVGKDTLEGVVLERQARGREREREREGEKGRERERAGERRREGV